MRPGELLMKCTMWAACTAKLLAFVMIVSSFFFLLIIVPMNAQASILYVGGIGFGNYTTIQEAVDAANPGDTVFVYGGLYPENVTIWKTISLVGENKENTTIDGGGTGNVVLVTANWVNITGFYVTNGSSAADFAGIQLMNVHHCYIADNNVSDNG